LVISDDIHRPTPVGEFVGAVLDELFKAGLKDENIEFIMALGTHRPMSSQEMTAKLGSEVTDRFEVHNHRWDDLDSLDLIGDTEQGVPVWINKKVSQADLVIGLGAIMPIEVCGFTGGGKILVPGLCGEITNSQMHWTRVDVSHHDILGKADNSIRSSIDELARKAGLDFIVNVIMNAQQQIVQAVAGDMSEAHRAGCKMAIDVHGVHVDKEYDIVIADGYPFDIEFWQVNKALDTAGIVVRKGGLVIIVSPCYEGFSQTHGEMLEFGYLPIKSIRHLVDSGKISHKVVAVHMMQVSAVAVEKAKVILVSSGISRKDTEKTGLMWAQTPQMAFEKALAIVGTNPSVAILKNAARMLPIMKTKREH
jgi:nickel-dependent lactate racemase